MNKEKLQATGFAELSEIELKNTDGGYGWLIIGCIGIAAITYFSMQD